MNQNDGFFWTGFYMLSNGNLIVGPYQGPVACQVLAKDTGVCWTGINQRKTIIFHLGNMSLLTFNKRV